MAEAAKYPVCFTCGHNAGDWLHRRELLFCDWCQSHYCVECMSFGLCAACYPERGRSAGCHACIDKYSCKLCRMPILACCISTMRTCQECKRVVCGKCIRQTKVGFKCKTCEPDKIATCNVCGIQDDGKVPRRLTRCHICDLDYCDDHAWFGSCDVCRGWNDICGDCLNKLSCDICSRRIGGCCKANTSMCGECGQVMCEKCRVHAAEGVVVCKTCHADDNAKADVNSQRMAETAF